MKTKLFIDFDKTLFNTDLFKERIFKVFSQMGFSQSEIDQTYFAESLSGKYDTNGQIEKLIKLRQFDTKIAEMKIKSIIFDAGNMLYNDSAEFLDGVNRKKYETDLLTFGDVDFQKKKLVRSGLKEKFDNCYYTDIEKYKYLEDLVEKDEFFIVIDDRGDALERISQNFLKAFMILITRDLDSTPGNNKFKGARVENLKQAARYL